MRKSLRRLAALFYVVGTVLVLVALGSAAAAAGIAEEEQASKVFWLTLLYGLVLVLPYLGLGAILNALAVLVPPDGRQAPRRPSPALESPGVTIDEVLDGPGSAALKRRILEDLLAVGDVTRAQYGAALDDPRVTEAPPRL